MPDPASPRPLHLLVGGSGRIRFGVDLDDVGRVLQHDQLPAERRAVNVPRLVGSAEADPERDRYAAVPSAGVDAHLRLGPETTVVTLPADRIEAVPRILERTSARWAWSGLCWEHDHVVVVLDAARLAMLGAPPSEREATP